jgi:hypothetical protein
MLSILLGLLLVLPCARHAMAEDAPDLTGTVWDLVAIGTNEVGETIRFDRGKSHERVIIVTSEGDLWEGTYDGKNLRCGPSGEQEDVLGSLTATLDSTGSQGTGELRLDDRGNDIHILLKFNMVRRSGGDGGEGADGWVLPLVFGAAGAGTGAAVAGRNGKRKPADRGRKEDVCRCQAEFRRYANAVRDLNKNLEGALLRARQDAVKAVNDLRDTDSIAVSRDYAMANALIARATSLERWATAWTVGGGSLAFAGAAFAVKAGAVTVVAGGVLGFGTFCTEVGKDVLKTVGKKGLVATVFPWVGEWQWEANRLRIQAIDLCRAMHARVGAMRLKMIAAKYAKDRYNDALHRAQGQLSRMWADLEDCRRILREEGASSLPVEQPLECYEVNETFHGLHWCEHFVDVAETQFNTVWDQLDNFRPIRPLSSG